MLCYSMTQGAQQGTWCIQVAKQHCQGEESSCPAPCVTCQAPCQC